MRLLDFGLAQMAEFDTLTALGDVPGTLAYISPERLQGRPATPAADVWAVGVVLWEALAGEHPFWGGDWSRRRAASSAAPRRSRRRRPDLPPRLLEVVASALLVNPQRRPAAERLARELRELPKRRKQEGRRRREEDRGRDRGAPGRRRARQPPPARRPGRARGGLGRSAPAVLSRPAGRSASPPSAPRSASPRRAPGSLFALAVAFFPLANISLGLAIVYAVLAAAWIALSWRDAQAGLLLALGPLLAPLAALALLPLAAQAARGRTRRRAAQVVAAVLLAALVAGLRKVPLPFDGATPPLGLGITGSTHPTAVASALWAAARQHPTLVVEALLLAGGRGASFRMRAAAARGSPRSSARRSSRRPRSPLRRRRCCR